MTINIVIFLTLKLYVHLFVLSVNFLVLTSLEDSFSCQQNVKYDSRREDVTLGLDVFAFVEFNDFGSNITGSATSEE